jgi:acyl phosphate:glycerol-3-phosphate acyltransferase
MPPIALWGLSNLLLLLTAYLFGSLPTGYILGKLLKGIDIREYGSGSTGATNVLRTLGKGPGAAVLAIDLLKGAAAIVLVRFFYQSNSPLIALAPANFNATEWFPWVVVLGGLAAVLGHSKSILLNFSGGKSVATGLGLLLALNWQVGLMAFGVFGLVFAPSRIVSLSSISAAIAVPILMVILKQPIAYILLGLVGGGYVVLRHRSNIQRLLAGTEPRVGQQPSETDLTPEG